MKHSEQGATKDQVCLCKAHWQLHVNFKDWSTPYLRIGALNGMRFVVAQVLCFSITRWS